MDNGNSEDSLVFDLNSENEGGVYRVAMTNAEGELNRHVMVNRGDKFQVTANLLDVAHGTVRDTGDDATLLIASFYFLPSRKKRFIEATITWAFTSDDPSVEIAVEKLAPEGSWSLAPVRQSLEKSVTGKANAGPGIGPVTASIGGEFGMKKTLENDHHTTIMGVKRMVNRDKGGFDAVRWTLMENEATKTGICRMLQVGILLKRTILKGETPKSGSAPKFRGELEMVVDKGGWSEVASKARRVWKKAEKDEAIEFQPGTDRNSGNFDINKTMLGDLDLQSDVMFMSLHQSFEDIRKEREERTRKKREERETQNLETIATTEGSAASTPIPSLLFWAFSVIAGVFGIYLWQRIYQSLIVRN